ncbi:MAG: response regulator [Candidatus Latescibacteria bacterium]|nr:response regulator [Candidatus Latescibacterota bacterium]
MKEKEQARILIVDDEPDLRLGLVETLQEEGYEVDAAGDGWAALEKVRSALFDLALVDLRMPGPDGMIVLDAIRRTSPETLVVVITGHATVESAVEAMKLGACDYLAKPFKLDQVRHVVRRAVEQKRLVDQNRRLRQEVEGYHRFEQLVGGSPRMQEVFRAVERAAPTSSTVLIYGETGTGKELVARALHRRSKRAEGPFIVVSCGAISEPLLESELFGHVRGAFTGAHADREGLFEAAQGGTALPGRDRGHPPGHADEAPPGAPGAGDPARGRDPHPEGGHPPDRGHPQGPEGREPRRTLPGGPLLPAQRPGPRRTPAARAEGGHTAPRAPLPPEVRPGDGQARGRRRAGGPGPADAIRLARQRPGASERHRAGGDPARRTGPAPRTPPHGEGRRQKAVP